MPSKVANGLAEFCFSSAVIFGFGGSIMFPGMTAGIVASHGVARVVLVMIIVEIVGGTAALLAIPAHFLSRHHTEERDARLDELSIRIDLLAARAAQSTAAFSEDDYRKLRSLLELRSHLVQHSIAQPSVEMVKRIPLAVLMPLGSTAAAWLAVLVK